MPTLAEIVGVEAPENDGVSFAPTVLSQTAGGQQYSHASGIKSGEQKEHEYLYWEFPGSKGWVAVRMGEWKGIVRKVLKGNTEMELYNLKEDPRESKDVASEHPEIVKEMWKAVKESHREANPDVPKFNMEINYPDSL